VTLELNATARESPLERAWRRSDRIFELLDPAALLTRPIALRQPFIFYLGHLPAFAWNHLGRRGLGLPAFAPELDGLFERGIDPPDDLEGVDAPEAWPQLATVLDYRERVRESLEPHLADAALRGALLMVLEHELMHHETLLYMMLRLPHELKRAPQEARCFVFDGAARPRRVTLAGGAVRLGAAPGSLDFGWDNEFPEARAVVADFEIDATPVRQSEFLEFVEAGGYRDRRLWNDEAWAWISRRDHGQPAFWTETEHGFTCRTLFTDVALEAAADWPVYVMWCEAAAFARFQGLRLPTEAEYVRAAFGTTDGPTRAYPWGDRPPDGVRANVGLRRWAPTPVGSCAGGATPDGVLDLVGSGWEWTATPFAPFDGFAPLPGYPGYSADFFDGRHYVLRGGSWATDDRLVRSSFRNWFQPHYPYVFAQFRCVRSAAS